MTDTILLVDDEQHIIDLAKMYLEQEGWKTRQHQEAEDHQYRARQRDAEDDRVLRPVAR